MDNDDKTPVENPDKPEIEQSVPENQNSSSTPQPNSQPDSSEPEITPFKPVQKKSNKKLFVVVGAVLVLLIVAFVAWWMMSHHKTKTATSVSTTTSSQAAKSPAAATSPSKVQDLQLDPNKNYGDKYADGILPVGDKKYQTSGPKKGYVYACSQYAQNLGTDSGGAGSRGPWFTDNNTEYNINKKLHVSGSKLWSASFSNKLNGNTRTIVTNDLPTHPTGIFPIASSDPAYQYDRNPNGIKGQALTFALNANPTYSADPNCMGGEVGVMLTGVALFSAFDAGGRDAGAWEIQDSCSGHPQNEGLYHYHTLSSCIKNISVQTIIGYALDGFPITGPDVGTKNILTTSDLDECHGIVSTIKVGGKDVTMYHYVMTEDFPYSVSCYRAKATQPPGMQTGSNGQTQTQSQQQSPTTPAQTPPPQMPPQARPPHTPL